MFILICLFVVLYMFYSTAKRTHRSKFLWGVMGFLFWLVLGGLFQYISEKLILHLDSVADAISMSTEKLVLQGIASLIILILSYLLLENVGDRIKKQVVKREEPEL